ncbi:hypothetical protein NHX12_012060 [Muraenolepis orangiensis]|uniref:C2H2-type domain-containing protein n=1 Tax=Muraenolepis orangiensis TaxID=630683 RepID=A0A9Q0DJ62_9TELE|nr:hypothetical protein NHX12_012060 [Muraenolepis orangiensis]
MATRTMFPAGVFSVGGQMMEDEGPVLSELPGNHLPVPQLVMLANAATAVGGGVESSAEVEEEEEEEEGDGVGWDGPTKEKEMVELKTVGCSYSDSEGENVRYSYDYQNQVEFCVVDYVDSPASQALTPAPRDWSKPAKVPPIRRKIDHLTIVESAKKKKPFHCKPCNYQAGNEEEFVEHLGTHAASKMMVVNCVEGRSKAKQATEAGGGGPAPDSEAAEGDMADSKGVIRCERCGYNTNRYDHYVAHLKHHSKEGEDHRVFKCTLCPYTTVSQYHWRKHLRNHFPSKLHTCDQCSYFSDRKSNYIQHIRTHTGVRPFRCPYCDYSSSQKTHLTRHMRTHSGERPFKCDSCNYLAANQHEVTRHARQVHNGPKPLACPYCPYKTADRSNYKKHVELHVNPRQFHCPLCKYAASKKCNLQYHIKSRHLGCDIPIDVSKVKLRVKKGSEDSAKSNKARSTDDEDDSDWDEYVRKPEPAAISLTTKKSGRHAQAVENEAETDRVQRRARSATADKEKGVAEGKGQRKLPTRQKKVAKVCENAKETSGAEDGPAAPPVKRSYKKKRQLSPPEVEEMSQVQGGSKETELAAGGESVGGGEPVKPIGEAQVTLQRSMEEMKKLQKETRMEKVRKIKQEKDELKVGAKTSRRLQSRRTGARKSDKTKSPKSVDVAMRSGPEEMPEVSKELGKVKAMKRKAMEALDLSTKHPSAETPAVGHSSPKKCKTSAADQPATKPSGSKVLSETTEPCPALEKDLRPKETAACPATPRKTRKTNKKTPVRRDSPVSIKAPPTDATSSATELQSDPTGPPPDIRPEENPTKPPLARPDVNTLPRDAAPPVPENNSTEDISVDTEAPSTGSRPSKETTPSPITDRHAAPVFCRPAGKAPRPALKLPRHGEEDEGIHSSHEGTSDVSDSASEGGSEDSGLNSAGAGSGKMPNDPETPTDEIPTPTELKSHLCVFCDRTFPLEVEYRRHVNRHLVNVYYPAAATAKGGK